jgi:hypothetical protein
LGEHNDTGFDTTYYLMIVCLKVYSDMAMWSTEVLLSSFWNVLQPGPQAYCGQILAIFALDPLNGRGITNWSVDGFQDSLSHIKISLFYDLFLCFSVVSYVFSVGKLAYWPLPEFLLVPQDDGRLPDKEMEQCTMAPASMPFVD